MTIDRVTSASSAAPAATVSANSAATGESFSAVLEQALGTSNQASNALTRSQAQAIERLSGPRGAAASLEQLNARVAAREQDVQAARERLQLEQDKLASRLAESADSKYRYDIGQQSTQERVIHQAELALERAQIGLERAEHQQALMAERVAGLQSKISTAADNPAASAASPASATTGAETAEAASDQPSTAGASASSSAPAAEATAIVSSVAEQLQALISANSNSERVSLLDSLISSLATFRSQQI